MADHDATPEEIIPPPAGAAEPVPPQATDHEESDVSITGLGEFLVGTALPDHVWLAGWICILRLAVAQRAGIINVNLRVRQPGCGCVPGLVAGGGRAERPDRDRLGDYYRVGDLYQYHATDVVGERGETDRPAGN